MMWAFIFIFMFAAFIAACIYLITRVRKFVWVDKLAKDRKWLSILISAAICVVFIVVLSLAMGYINAIIVTIYMILFWLVCEFAFRLVGKVKNRTKSTADETTKNNTIKNNAESSVKPKKRKIYYAGVAAIIITIVYMSWGWYQAHNVWQKDYTIQTDKVVGSIKLALIADSHTGITFDGDGFAEHVKEIQGQDLSEVMDRGGSRADIEDLVKALDDDKYQIVMDHQPADYAHEKAAGVDLVLSGHTHGGQMLLMKIFQEITGMGGNDQIYGLKDLDGSDFLVTSGISDWAIKFKTGCRSEYVIIDIRGK